ncbi:MAG: undecaprenyl-diphosphate phosphatase [Acidobacteria bacterium]|nr:undecaprenyl-diphosphate phosphatase [Acidobacteriota bacterium]
MNLWQAVVLAIFQGVTEFLPVSSTAHLALVPWIFRWNDPGLAFDVALHVGTLVAVLVYFVRTWLDLVLLAFGKNPAFDASSADLKSNPHLFWFLVLATIPAALAGWAFHEQVETTWRHPVVIAIALIGVALLMAWSERAGKQRKNLAEVGLLDSWMVGLAQAVALVPGVSRSGITMTAGLLRDLKRDTAARFSFLLSTPIIAGAALKELLNFPNYRVPAEMQTAFALGAIVSAIVGYATIALFLKYLQFGTFKIFIYYRLILGIIILALAFFFELGTGV